MPTAAKLAIVGTGNLGTAIARGLVGSGRYTPAELILTRRNVEPLEPLRAEGYGVQSDNPDAIRRATERALALADRR